MILVRDAWKNSFALVDSNKKALCDRGWNPLNYALLNDVSLFGNAYLKSNEKPRSVEFHRIQDLNVDEGLAGDVVSMLSSRQDLVKRRKKEEVRIKRTETSKNLLQVAKKLTSGIVFSAGKVHLDNHILSLVQNKANEEKKRKIELDIKNEKLRMIKEDKVNKVISSGSCYKSWTNDELKAMCGFFKKKGYPAIPSRKTDLVAYWERIVSENPVNFLNMSKTENVHDEIINDDNDDDCEDVITSVSL